MYVIIYLQNDRGFLMTKLKVLEYFKRKKIFTLLKWIFIHRDKGIVY
ncbi:hypothetical protein M947_11665 [Sulfurimonas hongkongensis]|uniref:Uncharacterized protein n=1 Tax=Sulfurimonas hongkongensis TaxID=1172190 RepID=T0KLN9_9BACT|nr:hypothetical protein M947_11665 [Sulfurimonas hongkongensis]